MKRSKPPNRKRPGVLVRFYPTDLARLNAHCADACTPRENFIRRCVLHALDLAALGQSPPPIAPGSPQHLAVVVARRAKRKPRLTSSAAAAPTFPNLAAAVDKAKKNR